MIFNRWMKHCSMRVPDQHENVGDDERNGKLVGTAQHHTCDIKHTQTQEDDRSQDAKDKARNALRKMAQKFRIEIESSSAFEQTARNLSVGKGRASI